MFRSGLFLLSACALAVAGCQTRPLSITPFKSGGEGAPYALRFTQYDIKLKWRVTGCSLADGFSVAADVEATPTFPDDLSKRWLLDLRSLDGWMNTTDVQVTYEGGRFKSFNATVEDRTVETATAVFGAVAKIAGLVGVAAGPNACQQKVDQAEQATNDVKAKTAALATARRQLLLLEAQGAHEKALRKARAAVGGAAEDLAKAVSALETALKAVTFEEPFLWPANGSLASQAERSLPAKALTHWDATAWSASAAKIKVKLDLGVYGADGALAPAPAEPASMDAMVARGRIPVRVARRGALVVKLEADGTESEIGRKESAIMQSGDIIYVPVEYRWPRSSAAGFGLDADGYLASVSHKQSSAPGETLGKAAGAVAEQLAPLFPSKLDKLKAENELLEARKTNAELQAALAPAPDSEEALALKALQQELTLKKAKLELLQTDAALKAFEGS